MNPFFPLRISSFFFTWPHTLRMRDFFSQKNDLFFCNGFSIEGKQWWQKIGKIMSFYIPNINVIREYLRVQYDPLAHYTFTRFRKENHWFLQQKRFFDTKIGFWLFISIFFFRIKNFDFLFPWTDFEFLFVHRTTFFPPLEFHTQTHR